MELKVSDGSVFKLTGIDRERLEAMSPCKFVALLIEQNRGLPWEVFDRTNISDIIDLVIAEYKPEGLGDAMDRSPFKSNYHPAITGREHLEKVLRYQLPATPNPAAIGLPPDAIPITFDYEKKEYRLPVIVQETFDKGQLNVKHFLRSLIEINANTVGVISFEFLRSAVKKLAWEGFPDTSKLGKKLISQVKHSEERKLLGKQSLSVLLRLKIDRHDETDDYSSGHSGFVKSKQGQNIVPMANRMGEARLELMKSDNRFLSIHLQKAKKPRPNREIEAEKFKLGYDVREVAEKGLIGLVWYGWFDLVAEYKTPKSRDKASIKLRQACRQGRLAVVARDIKRIAPEKAGLPELVISWKIAFKGDDTPAMLSEALSRFFDGTGYTSSYTYGRFDQPENIIRLIFHKMPPSGGGALQWDSSRERRFRTEVIAKGDFPLQKSPTPEGKEDDDI